MPRRFVVQRSTLKRLPRAPLCALSQFELHVWDEATQSHTLTHDRLRTHYVFPDRNKRAFLGPSTVCFFPSHTDSQPHPLLTGRSPHADKILAALRATAAFNCLQLTDLAVQFPVGVSPLKFDLRDPKAKLDTLDKPLAVAEFKRLTRRCTGGVGE
jgi:hypothetical protein